MTKPTPNTQDEWTTHALNIHGVFFERRCAHEIDGVSGWSVLSRNHPVEFPLPNGPIRGKESSLDIWARNGRNPNAVIDALVECKKANPEFVNWVFFLKQGTASPAPMTVAGVNNTVPGDRSQPWRSDLHMRKVNCDYPLADDAREVRGDYLAHQSGSKTRTSNAAIQEAAYQVALASRSVAAEEAKLLGQMSQVQSQQVPPWSLKVYFPVVVTTANLYTIVFDPNHVDLATGEVPIDSPALSPIDCVVFEYSLPKHLQFAPATAHDALKYDMLYTISRMHIIVVNSTSLSKLLRELAPESS